MWVFGEATCEVLASVGGGGVNHNEHVKNAGGRKKQTRE